MLLYFIIILMVCWGVYRYDVHCQETDRPAVYLGVVLISFILLFGFSANMGIDWISYFKDFSRYPSFSNLDISQMSIGGRMQPLWVCFMSFAKEYLCGFGGVMLVHAIFVNTVIFWYVYHHSNVRFLVILFYFISFEAFYFNIEILRESISISLFLLGLAFYYDDNRKIYYYLLAFIAFLFHSGAIVVFAFPYIFSLIEKFRGSRYFYVGLIVFGLVLANLDLFIQAASSSFLGGVQQQFSYYNSLEHNTNAAYAKLFDLSRLIILYVVYKRNGMRQSLFENCFLLYSILGIADLFSTGLYRFQNYLFIPYLIFALETIWNSLQNRRVSWGSLAFVVMSIVSFLYSYSYSFVFKGHKYYLYEIYVPYRSVFGELI